MRSEPDAIPAELSRGPAPMAVRATNNALAHFATDGRCRAAGEHPTNRPSLRLRIDVVEVENDGIRLTAVHAGVGQQELVDHVAIHSSASRP